ncbi:hypothetical protein VTN31DRAFT_128 [Thermomyces dupontii]|uniref:uncharacterized protein n=1 Tax=Talaromyces thermophilus TaxID=28565 RepID=UPI00374457A9
MAENFTQGQATSTTNNATVSIEVDTSDENDSSYGDELSSYSASLISSVLNYRHENGRRYHGFRDGSYMLPNDESENDRLDMLHELCLQVLRRKICLAPIKNPQRVIDLATGTVVWAIDFADQHPEAEVIGCDLSPIQPTLVPPNMKFLVDDIETEWAYESSPFDFIHARNLMVSTRDFGRLLKETVLSIDQSSLAGGSNSRIGTATLPRKTAVSTAPGSNGTTTKFVVRSRRPVTSFPPGPS